jgi:purine-cytosine permease-like protein
VAGISAIFVPCATMIMVMDVFIVPRLFGLRRPTSKVTMWHDAAPINWVGVIALVIGLVVGSYTGGLIPGIPGFGTTNIGFPAAQSWALSCLCYLAGVWLVQHSPQRTMLLGYPKHALDVEAATAQVAGAPTK